MIPPVNEKRCTKTSSLSSTTSELVVSQTGFLGSKPKTKILLYDIIILCVIIFLQLVRT